MPEWIPRKLKELNEIQKTMQNLKEEFNKDIKILSWVLTAVILATLEAEIMRITFQSQLGQIVCESLPQPFTIKGW
jgi:hypothetical protein